MTNRDVKTQSQTSRDRECDRWTGTETGRVQMDKDIVNGTETRTGTGTLDRWTVTGTVTGPKISIF